MTKIWWKKPTGWRLRKKLQFESKIRLLENQWELKLQMKTLLTEFLLAQQTSVFCSIPAFNWFNEAHPYYKGQSALNKAHQFKCKPHSKHLPRNTYNNVLPNIWTPWPHQSTWHKINHLKYLKLKWLVKPNVDKSIEAIPKHMLAGWHDTTILENIGAVYCKLNIYLSYSPAILI